MAFSLFHFFSPLRLSYILSSALVSLAYTSKAKHRRDRGNHRHLNHFFFSFLSDFSFFSDLSFFSFLELSRTGTW